MANIIAEIEPVCVESVLGSDGTHVLAAFSTAETESSAFATFKMLLQWPTDTLPSGMNVASAWLRLFVIDKATDDGEGAQTRR